MQTNKEMTWNVSIWAWSNHLHHMKTRITHLTICNFTYARRKNISNEYTTNIAAIFFFLVLLTRNRTASFNVVSPNIQASPCSPRCTHIRRSVVLVLVNTLRFPMWLPCMWYQNCKHTLSFGSSQSLKISALSPCCCRDASMKRKMPRENRWDD